MVKNELIEVELRAKLPKNSEALANFKNIKESFERDIYYRYESDLNKDWIVRLRNKDNKYYLTYKSNHTNEEGAWNEVNIQISKSVFSQLGSFFLTNGYYVDVKINKKRRTIKVNKIVVNIDSVENLGLFIEAEILTQKNRIKKARNEINNLFSKLSISEADITSKGYVTLMREKYERES